jgi:DNA-binding transcriptional MerR regulator
MNSFTIKDLENLSGIKAHTIRIWEQRYSFLKPRRTNTNIRLYSNENLKKILNISLLNKYGYKISHINTMSEAEMKEKIFSLNATEARQDYIVNELIQCMVDLDTDRLEKILQSHIETRGIQKTVIQIIFPFLEKIGILWLTNHINPAQEHLVCNIIRQKLIVAIENTPTQIKKENAKTVLLFLPEGEYHELGLLFICYLLKSKGIQTIYLGCSISLADVQYIVKLKKPHFLYCHLTATGKKFNFEKFVTTIANSFATPVIISGRLTSAYHKKKPSSISFKTSFPQVMEFIDTI